MPGFTRSLLIIVIIFVSLAALLGGTLAEARDKQVTQDTQQNANGDSPNEELLTEDAPVNIAPEPATMLILIGGGVGLLITKFPRRRKIAK